LRLGRFSEHGGDRNRFPICRALKFRIRSPPSGEVRIDRDNHYLWLKKDPDYAAAFDIAKMRGVDVLEAEAVRRAHEGVTKPIFHGGKRVIDVVQNPELAQSKSISAAKRS
jgi:hypothetical protein